MAEGVKYLGSEWCKVDIDRVDRELTDPTHRHAVPSQCHPDSRRPSVTVDASPSLGVATLAVDGTGGRNNCHTHRTAAARASSRNAASMTSNAIMNQGIETSN
jgi:hypothetical protein